MAEVMIQEMRHRAARLRRGKRGEGTACRCDGAAGSPSGRSRETENYATVRLA